MLERRHCTIGILRPPEVEASRYFQYEKDSATDGANVSETIWMERVEAIIENIREMLFRAAEELRMRISLTEYQLHGIPPGSVMGRRRARNVHEKDVLVTVDPPPSVYRFAVELSHHPLKRTVIAFTSKEMLSQMLSILCAEGIPVLDSRNPEQQSTLRRVFPLFIPPNAENAATSFKDGQRIISRALLYPHGDTRPANKDDVLSLKLMDSESAESQPEFRHNLVEEDTH